MAGPEPAHGQGHCVNSKLGLSQHLPIEVSFCDFSQILQASWQPMFTMIVLAEIGKHTHNPALTCAHGREWEPSTPDPSYNYLLFGLVVCVCFPFDMSEDNLARHPGAWCVQCKHTGETRLLASQPFVWQKSYIQCHLLYIQYTRHVFLTARESENLFYIYFLNSVSYVQMFLQFISLMKYKRNLWRRLILYFKIAFGKPFRPRTNKVVC